MNNNAVFSTRSAVLIGLMAALMCICGPFSIPIGPVPIALTNLVIYVAALLLGAKRGTLSCLIYLLLGFVGLPVFAGFTGGIAKLVGPTGGYLIGYLLTAFISGFFADKFGNHKGFVFLGLLLGTLTLYLFGSLWLSFQAQLSFFKALSIGVFPFILGDLLKMILAIFLANAIKKRIHL